MKPTLTIVGGSARAAAASAVRAGYAVRAADLFADVDLCRLAEATRVDSYPQDLARIVQGPQPGGWMYTGALENHPALVESLAAARPLYGNTAPALRAVRSPRLVARALARAGISTPAVAPRGAQRPPAGDWLSKPRRSAGGAHIVPWDGRWPIPRSRYLQELIGGDSYSGVYLAAGRRAHLLGITRQLVGVGWTGTSGFRYCGSVGPVRLADAATDAFMRTGDALAQAFGLKGLFGVDAIVNDGGVWPVEVNPRYTASVEVLERTLNIAAIAWHVAACRDGELPRDPPTDRQEGAAGASGKAILFARSRAVAGDCGAAANEPGQPCQWADIPHPGTLIEQGWPIVSLLADGRDSQEVLARLRGAAERFLADLVSAP